MGDPSSDFFPSFDRYVMSSRGLVRTCLISRLLSFMVVSISKLTRIYWKMNAHILLLGHLEEYSHWQEIRNFHWRMWGILFLMNVTRCLNHSVSFFSPLNLFFHCNSQSAFLISWIFCWLVMLRFLHFLWEFSCIMQTWGKMCRRYSRWLLMISKLWCFLQHSAKKYAQFARNLCKM